MKRSTKNRAEGAFHELKGSIKAKVGKLTKNRRLEAKGIVEKVGGKIQKKAGQAESAIERP